MNKNPILNALGETLKKVGIDKKKVCITSDIFYKPEDIKPLGVDFYHTHRGRSIAFATGLKLGNPALKVIAFIGDLSTLGGNHFVHAGRRNMNLVTICINNYIYPFKATKKPVKTFFSTYSNFERPFNMPHLAKSCGAVFVARWTSLHTKELSASITKALQKSGFSAIEVISPGGHYFAGIPDLKEEPELIKFYYKNSEIKNGEETMNLEIEFGKKIIVGEFIDRERPTFIDLYNKRLSKVLGDKFEPYGGNRD